MYIVNMPTRSDLEHFKIYVKTNESCTCDVIGHVQHTFKIFP